MANRQQLEEDARWKQLQNDRKSYFQGCNLTLFPNGEKEIWIGNEYGVMAITATGGPKGISIQIHRSVGSELLTVDCDHKDGIPHDTDYVTITQYRPDPASQAFKQWYGLRGWMKENQQHRAAYEEGKEFAKLDNVELTDEFIRLTTGTDETSQKAFRAGYWAHKAGISV